MYSGSEPHEAGTVLKETFEVDGLIATGTASRVYKGHRVADSSRVAIKELFMQDMPPDRMEQVFMQFDQEGALLKKLQHKSLVEIMDCFSSAGRRYIVMQFLEGETLESAVKDGQAPPSVVTVLEWMDQVCDVLIYLHEHDPSIVLRDLHPGNIMLAPDGKSLHVIDFGIAKAMDGKGTILRDTGTTGFAPVEQFGGQGIDHRVDVYALGATLYALLTQQNPPASQTRVMDDPLKAPDTINPAIPKSLNDLILKLMTLSRAQRPDSVRTIREELKAIYEPIKPKPAAPPPKAGKAGCMPIVLLALLALAVPALATPTLTHVRQALHAYQH